MLDRMFWSWVSNLKSVNIMTNLVQQLVILLLSSFSTTPSPTVVSLILVVGVRYVKRLHIDALRFITACKSMKTVKVPGSLWEKKHREIPWELDHSANLSISLLFPNPKPRTRFAAGAIWLWTWDGGLHWRSLIIRSKLSDLGPEVVVCTEDQLKTGVSFFFCLFCTKPWPRSLWE